MGRKVQEPCYNIITARIDDITIKKLKEICLTTNMTISAITKSALQGYINSKMQDC